MAIIHLTPAFVCRPWLGRSQCRLDGHKNNGQSVVSIAFVAGASHQFFSIPKEKSVTIDFPCWFIYGDYHSFFFCFSVPFSVYWRISGEKRVIRQPNSIPIRTFKIQYSVYSGTFLLKRWGLYKMMTLCVDFFLARRTTRKSLASSALHVDDQQDYTTDGRGSRKSLSKDEHVLLLYIFLLFLWIEERPDVYEYMCLSISFLTFQSVGIAISALNRKSGTWKHTELAVFKTEHHLFWTTQSVAWIDGPQKLDKYWSTVGPIMVIEANMYKDSVDIRNRWNDTWHHHSVSVDWKAKIKTRVGIKLAGIIGVTTSVLWPSGAKASLMRCWLKRQKVVYGQK